MVPQHAVPRILLTGKDGQVGFELQRALAPLGEVFAIGRADCDLTDPHSIRAMVEASRPDIIVNCAAYSAVDAAETEPEVAYAVNAAGPAVLAEEAAKTGALLVHYSTDYVFDGRKQGRYREQDAAAPLSAYGMSKFAGEHAIRRRDIPHLIIRTSWVYGVHGKNFLKTIVRLAQERDSLRIVADQVGAPTSAALIADVTAEILRQFLRGENKMDDADRFGTFHLTASGETSWHGYAKSIVRTGLQLGTPMRLGPEQVMPISTDEYPLPARRPANSRLNTDKLRSTFNIVLPDWEVGVTDVLDKLNKGRRRNPAS
jgi:dTDP-4-dehydrorhamnose reductase